MIFRYRQRSLNSLPQINLSIDGHNLERVRSFDFLGLTINENLNWKDHIHKVSTKISKVIGILARTKKFLNSSILAKIYNSLILSRINYGILCWGFEHKRIYQLQKKAIRLVCKTRYNAHTDPLFIQLKTLKVKDIYHIQCLKFSIIMKTILCHNTFKISSFVILLDIHMTRGEGTNFEVKILLEYQLKEY